MPEFWWDSILLGFADLHTVNCSLYIFVNFGLCALLFQGYLWEYHRALVTSMFFQSSFAIVSIRCPKSIIIPAKEYADSVNLNPKGM